MWISVVLAFLVAVFATNHAAPSYFEQVELKLHNYIDELVRNALEYIRSLMIKNDPFTIPDPPQQTVTGDNINLVAKFTNVEVSNASDFTIDHIENSLLGMWAKFGVTIPHMHLVGDFEVAGSFNGTGVVGQGNFRLNMTQFNTTGYVQVGISQYWLEMKELDIDYTVENLEFDEDGLVVYGMTSDEIKKLFSQSFMDYCRDNEKYISSQVAEYVMGIANGIMRGKTLTQLLQWLKDIINY